MSITVSEKRNKITKMVKIIIIVAIIIALVFIVIRITKLKRDEQERASNEEVMNSNEVFDTIEVNVQKSSPMNENILSNDSTFKTFD